MATKSHLFCPQLFEMFTKTFSNHLDELSGGLIHIDYVETFSTEDGMDRIIRHLTTSKIRTFVALTGPQDAVKMICRASHSALTGSGFVWILPGYSDANWWRKLQHTCNCTEDELESALETTLFFVPTKHPLFTQEDQVRASQCALVCMTTLSVPCVNCYDRFYGCFLLNKGFLSDCLHSTSNLLFFD